jgi:hypothetical protein
MRGKGLVLLALGALIGAPAIAADLPLGPPPAAGRGAPSPHEGGPPPALQGFRPGAVWGHGGVAWGLVPGLGQLGAAGYGYYAVRHCWAYQPVYGPYGDFAGQAPVNVCVD